jgi:hypothetical protein
MIKFKVHTEVYNNVPVLTVESAEATAVEFRGGLAITKPGWSRAYGSGEQIDIRLHRANGEVTDWIPVHVPRMETATPHAIRMRSFELGG